MFVDVDHDRRRAEMIRRHGKPRHVDAAAALRLLGRRSEVHPLDVSAWLYRDQAAADAWAASNAEYYGHPSLGTAPAGDGVVGVLDLRPGLARHGTEPVDSALPDRPSGDAG